MGVLGGAALTFTAKADKSGLALTAMHLLDPSGTVVPLAPSEVTAKGAALTIKKTLPTSGVWTVVLGAKPGPAGQFSYSYKLKQPPKVAYSAD